VARSILTFRLRDVPAAETQARKRRQFSEKHMPTKTATKINIRPLHDKILVKRDEAESKTASGIYLPESSVEKPTTARVLAVGDGKINADTGERITLEVKVGDRIMISKWGGTEIKIGDEECLILSEDDILAIVD
jgi:chaperonin GroES